MLSKRHIRLISLWGALAALLSTPALAQQIDRNDENETAAGRALFDQGMAAVDREDFATAEDRLRRSLQLRDSAVVRVNLALVLIELGRLVEAAEHLRRAQRMDDVDPRVATLAADQLMNIEPLLGTLRIDVTGHRDGVSVVVDGELMPEALIGVAHPVDPTMHEVVLRRGEVVLGREEITVDSGGNASLELLARPPTAEETAALAESVDVRVLDDRVVTPAAPGIESEWWLWVIVGAVVAGAAVGITVGVLEGSGTQSPDIRGDDGRIHLTLTGAFP